MTENTVADEAIFLVYGERELAYGHPSFDKHTLRFAKPKPEVSIWST